MFSGLGNRRSGTRQYNRELGELARLRVDLNRTAMLLDDDVVTEGKAETGSFARGLRLISAIGTQEPSVTLAKNGIDGPVRS